MKDFLPWLFIHENVPSFPDDFMRAMLGDVYDIESLVFDAKDCGVPVCRKRRYTLCRRRDRLRQIGSAPVTCNVAMCPVSLSFHLCC